MHCLQNYFDENSMFQTVDVNGSFEYRLTLFHELPKFCTPFTETILPPNSIYKRLVKIFKVELSLQNNYRVEENSDDTSIFISNTGELNHVEIETYLVNIDEIKLTYVSNEKISNECNIKCFNSLQYIINRCLEAYHSPQIILRILNMKDLIENNFEGKSARIFYDILIDYFFSDDMNFDSDFEFRNYRTSRAYLRKIYELEAPEDYDHEYIY